MALITLLSFATLLGVGDCSSGVLFHKKQGVYIENSVIPTVYAYDELECGMHCSIETFCVSANYKKSGENQGACQLNNRSIEEVPRESFFKNTDYVYLEKFEKQSSKPLPVTEGLGSSLILNGNADYINQLVTWLNDQTNWRICYRATQNGWEGTDFHSLCDNKGPTVTMVRVQDYIFGGYSNISWEGTTGYKESAGCFLFSVKNKDNLAPFKAPVREENKKKAIYNDSSRGPTFGGGFDLYISNNAHQSGQSYANIGISYQTPSGYTAFSTEAKTLLAGTIKFIPNEVEVFYLDQ